jgi:hypothetical protein
MPDPSPATASIVRAFDDRYELLGPFEANWQEVCIAAALRAAAGHLGSSGHLGSYNASTELLVIAAEMEAM